MSESEAIKGFAQLKAAMEQIAAQRKNLKSKIDEFQTSAVQAMRLAKKRYIDESGTGAGPFWTLCKDSKEGNWKDERYNDFFTMLLSELRNGKTFTPEQITAEAKKYLKQFEKRDLKLEKHTTIRHKGTDDLELWLQTGAHTE